MSEQLTSIVILTLNELDYTRRCIEGIASTTPEPHELVLVDNGSTDGTLEYLRSIPGAVVIDNGRNLGFGGGCNVGMAASAGDRILLLNNDVVPTTGWLSELHAVLDAHPDAGLVGPRTNRITGDQQVDDLGYDTGTLDGLDAFAATWRARHAGQSTDTPRLVGFAILMERGVVERIGGFDLRYELGNFEDDDLCLRAGVAGFGCRVAHASFIHHYGSRTFTGQQIDHTRTMVANYRRFMDAWGIDQGEIDPGTYAYRPERVLAATSFDPARHHAPLAGVPDGGERVTIEPRRATVLAICCDRLDPSATERALRAALQAIGPGDDTTVAIRVDPRDVRSLALLEQVADEVGDEQLPDIAIVSTSDVDDRSILRASGSVVVDDAGRWAWARRRLAEHLGVTPVALRELGEPG